MASKKTVAAYVRVSTRQQDGALQRRAIAAWAKAQGVGVRWFEDKFTGRTMERPGWADLIKSVRRGRYKTVVVWKLDRLGRTVSGLARLFDELKERGVGLVSLTESFDLSKPMGRLLANILASVAEYETEVRGERVRSGQEAARAAGRRWGGSKPGWTKLSGEQVEAVRRLDAAGHSKAAIARTVGVSRPTVYRVLAGANRSA